VTTWVPVDGLPIHDPDVAALRPRGLRVPVTQASLCIEGRGSNADGTPHWIYQAPFLTEAATSVVDALIAEAASAGWSAEPLAVQPPQGIALRLSAGDDVVTAIVAVRAR
jgi:hypothetical protein